MFPCPNCGGQLRFSPEHQSLLCKSCGETTDVNGYQPDEKIGTDSVTTNIYQCPNCAGEIQLIDNDGMEFCPYCGSQATMQEKFSDEGVPKYILPFRFTKEMAKEKYVNKASKIHFAPEGLKADENIEKMVGMYVPYYLYEYSVNDHVTFKGRATSSSGDYDITRLANVDVDVDVNNLKVPFDASQTLDDSIASMLEPFPMDEVMAFNPGYLAGYFVENSTVDDDLYIDESQDKAVDYLTNQVLSKSQGYTPDLDARQDIEMTINSDIHYADTEGAYLPMYFMTTRYNDRVAYSIVNGANGNIYMDMPIVKSKMIKTALKLSAILFVIILVMSFVMDYSFKVKNMCGYAAFISSLIAYYGASYANKTYRKDLHLDDKGYFGTRESARNHGNATVKKNSAISTKIISTASVIFLAVALFVISEGSESFIVSLIPWVALIASVVLIIAAMFTVKKGKKKVLGIGFLGWLLAVTIRILNPANDLYYYGVLIAAFIVIIFAASAIVDEYNRFATHPSPQFGKKGGGLERARD